MLATKTSWLNKFLGTSHRCSVEEAPPIDEPSKDTYMKMFADSFEKAEKPEMVKDGEDVIKDDVIKTVIEATFLVPTSSSEPNARTVQLHNLPYNISEDEINAMAAKQGFSFEKVTLGYDKKTGRPSGSATCVISSLKDGKKSKKKKKGKKDKEKKDKEGGEGEGVGVGVGEVEVEGENSKEESQDQNAAAVGADSSSTAVIYDAAACVKAMNGIDCGGRAVRASLLGGSTHGPFSGGGGGGGGSGGGGGGLSRYFGDISKKCKFCNEVGHMGKECPNPVATLCHLCAGKDHEAVDCPNITCFRCSQFGHHSRECRNVPMSKAVICTNCGSATHDIRGCAASSRGAKGYEKLESRLMRCMSCDKLGHAMCQEISLSTTTTTTITSTNTKTTESTKSNNKRHINFNSKKGKGNVVAICAPEDEVFCSNCGDAGHHLNFPRAAKGTPSKVCYGPKADAFTRYPALLQTMDGTMDGNKNVADGKTLNAYFRRMIGQHNTRDMHLFPSLLAEADSSFASSGGDGSYEGGGGGGGGGNYSLASGRVVESASFGSRNGHNNNNNNSNSNSNNNFQPRNSSSHQHDNDRHGGGGGERGGGGRGRGGGNQHFQSHSSNYNNNYNNHNNSSSSSSSNNKFRTVVYADNFNNNNNNNNNNHNHNHNSNHNNFNNNSNNNSNNNNNNIQQQQQLQQQQK